MDCYRSLCLVPRLSTYPVPVSRSSTLEPGRQSESFSNWNLFLLGQDILGVPGIDDSEVNTTESAERAEAGNVHVLGCDLDSYLLEIWVLTSTESSKPLELLINGVGALEQCNLPDALREVL